MKKMMLISFFSFTFYSQVLSQIDPVNAEGVAIGGYDVIAYFEEGKAIKGDQKYAQQFNSVTYYFSSKENQKLFEAAPQNYLPQYDGYCALAVSYGKKISVDPQTFKLTDGKLYLFYNGKTSHGVINSLETWNKNEEKLLKKANSLWPEVKKRKYKREETF